MKNYFEISNNTSIKLFLRPINRKVQAPLIHKCNHAQDLQNLECFILQRIVFSAIKMKKKKTQKANGIYEKRIK